MMENGVFYSLCIYRHHIFMHEHHPKPLWKAAMNSLHSDESPLHSPLNKPKQTGDVSDMNQMHCV